MRHLRLGATLYLPATRPDLVAVALGRRLPGLRSLAICTEDAVAPADLEAALANLEAALPEIDTARAEGGGEAESRPLRFIRVRNPHVMGRLLAARGIAAIDGFILPKVTAESLEPYLTLLTQRDPFLLMPTLETAEAFDPAEMVRLRAALSAERVRPRILALRIGGNDLLNTIAVRRSPETTIYETAIGPLIGQLVGLFKPHGFALTAPVFEGLNHAEVLAREVARDLMHGLTGKTAVHPGQIPIIEAGYRVSAADLQMAAAILGADRPAVFRMHDTMCEGTVHMRWAREIQARAALFGVAGAAGPVSLAVGT